MPKNNARTVWSSSDGIHWTEETAAADFTTSFYSGAALADRMFLVGHYEFNHYENDVWSSDDGTTWRLAHRSEIEF